MKYTQAVLLALLAGPAAGQAAAPPEAVIESSNAGWEEAFNTGDTSALTRLYAEGATVVPPSMEIVNDHPEIAHFWAAKYGAGTRDFKLDTINLRVEGDRIYQTSVWSASVNSAGHSHPIDGEMTSVLERQADGSWKIALQNWY